jgi:MSHA pilin protein MshD
LNFRPRAQRGVSLVELIVSIVIISVAVAGVLAALNRSTRASADPMIQKQALAIAEALLEEVQLQPFTYCDPDDANAPAALGAADCTGGAAGANDENNLPLGPEAGETRTGSVTPFDNVSDYNGFPMSPGIADINGAAIIGLDAYSAIVSVTKQALGTISLEDALLVTVTVTGPASTSVTLHGYRVRYAPNALP